MRTDSPAVAADAQLAARTVIQAHFPEALPEVPPTYRAKGGAQEAHECIRPTVPSLQPDDTPLSGNQKKLYQLIWTRFIQSQMKPATIAQVVVTIQPNELPYLFTASGNTLTDPGWLVLSQKETKDTTLPQLSQGQPLTLTKLDQKEQWTKPPSRYTEPKLIQALEKAGVGRPSTYASIMETIQERGYVNDTGKALEPTPVGIKITAFLTEQFTDLLNLDFTKQMEDDLDRIAQGKVVWTSPLSEFYTSLTKALEGAKQALIKSGILIPCPKCEGVVATLTGKYGEYQRCLSCNYKPSSGTETGEDCPECGKALLKRNGKNGEFVSCSGYPGCKYSPSKGKETGEECPECGKALYERKGKKGSFVGCSGYPECKFVLPTNTTGESCPDCGKPLQNKKSKKGTFVGCSGYPECRYIKPQNTIGKDCPDCGKPLCERKSKHGVFVGCSGYPECKYTHAQFTK